MSNATTKSMLRMIVKQNLRSNLPERDAKSVLIWDRLSELDCFQAVRRSGNLMIYLDFDAEVRTTCFLPVYLGVPQTSDDFMSRQTPSVIVPYCEGLEIVPFELRALDELEPGMSGIKEPKQSIRDVRDRRCLPASIGLVVVPGLAFDRSGARLGRGKGYYDRFLARLRPGTLSVALAFECQIFAEIPCEPYDKRVDMIITEDRVLISDCPFA